MKHYERSQTTHGTLVVAQQSDAKPTEVDEAQVEEAIELFLEKMEDKPSLDSIRGFLREYESRGEAFMEALRFEIELVLVVEHLAQTNEDLNYTTATAEGR